MEVAEQSQLLTVDQMVDWLRVGPDAIELAEKLAAPAYDIRQALSGVYTSTPIGVYLSPVDGHAGIDVDCGCTPQDFSLVKSAVSRVASVDLFCDCDPDRWIKVAFSPAIRSAGKALGFFPGVKPDGTLSGSPSPVRGRVRAAEVERGGVDRPDSPMFLNTRALGEGQPYDEWRKDRDKLYRDRRHKESKEI